MKYSTIILSGVVAAWGGAAYAQQQVQVITPQPGAAVVGGATTGGTGGAGATEMFHGVPVREGTVIDMTEVEAAIEEKESQQQQRVAQTNQAPQTLNQGAVARSDRMVPNEEDRVFLQRMQDGIVQGLRLTRTIKANEGVWPELRDLATRIEARQLGALRQIEAHLGEGVEESDTPIYPAAGVGAGEDAGSQSIDGDVSTVLSERLMEHQQNVAEIARPRASQTGTESDDVRDLAMATVAQIEQENAELERIRGLNATL